jgi:flagellar motor switch/type III secretory pathway protein FliN
VIARAPAQQVSFFWTILFLVGGIFPLYMLVRFWTSSGTGLHPFLVGYALAHAVSLLVALNYFTYYRRYKPRSIVLSPPLTQPAGLLRGFLLALTMVSLLGVGAYNMLAHAHGLGLSLSPGPAIERGRVLSTMAKVVGTALSPGLLTPVQVPPRKPLDIKRQRWLVNPPFMYGALWGALGYAIPFGFLGLVLGLLRHEVPDPRDEHVGVGLSARLVRGAVGFYYGGAMGFFFGAALIVVLRTLFPSVSVVTPAVILHWIYTFGAASHPNVAFSYAFSSACMLSGAFGLILGRVDFTARVSDPKAEEFTRPIEVQIPAIEPAPLQGFDPVRVEAETQRILKQFELECQSLLRLPDWTVERYEMPLVNRPGGGTEPETANVISAREAVSGDDDAPSAMGSLSNVYVQIVADLGRLELSAADWLTLAEGVILELPKSPDGTIGVSINGRLAGRGRPLTINGNKAVKMISLKPGVEKLLRVNPG